MASITSETGGRKPFGRWLRWLLVLALLWFGGLIHFTIHLPTKAVDSAYRSEAIVVFTGGADRIDTGVRLLREGAAKKLFVTGVNPALNEGEVRQLFQELGKPGLFDCCVVIDRRARNTVANALETSQWLAEQNFTSFRLVTGAYHMPRALLLMRRQTPDAIILEHPVTSTNVRLDSWWRFPKTAQLLAGEYSKYYISLLAARAGDLWRRLY